MKKKYLFILLALLQIQIFHTQTTENFETETTGSTTFADNGQNFTITNGPGETTYDIEAFTGAGWNGSAPDNKFIDNSGGLPTQNDGSSFTISTTDGTDITIKSFYLFLSKRNLTTGLSTTLTIAGKKNGLTVYTLVKSSGIIDGGNFTPNNGFTFINLATEGGTDNSNSAVDELIISSTNNGDYLALDAIKWQFAPVCTNPSIPTVTSAPGIICDGNSALLSISGTKNDATKWHVYTGSCGGTAIGSTTGSSLIVTPTTGTTTYFVRGEGGCVTPGSCGTVSITTTTREDATFSYSSSSYCVNAIDPTPTITGVTGGTFSSTSGLSINTSTGTVDVSASTPGTYSVTYNTSGLCDGTENVSLTINSLDNASFNYASAAYCNNNSDPNPTITGIAGGTFSSTAGLSINASTGQVDVSASTPGSYTVTYTTNGPCPNSSNVNLSINSLDNASFSYGAASYCSNDSDPTPTITGLAGGTFSSTTGLSINASTGQVDVSASTAGSYTVTYTTAGTCPNSSNVNLSINGVASTPTITHTPNTVCDGSNATLIITGSLNSSAEWTIYTSSCGGTLVGATTTNSFTVTPTSPSTTYFVRGEGGCSAPGLCGSLTITTTANDDASFSYGNSTYCQSDTDPTPTISGLAGGSFTVSPSGLTINASTGEIDLSASTPNIYAITYTTNGPCTNNSIEYITIAGPTFGFDVIAACDSYTWIDGITYTESNNTATQSLTNSNGCDSTATLNLTINNSDNVTDTQVACNTFTWIDGNTYTTNNNSATFTLQNTKGCDSIVALDLTINNSNTGVDNQTICGSYTWIDGNTYTTDNNSATFTVSNSFGCDSLVTLNLDIVTSLTGTDTQTACDSYAWIDGNTYTTNNNTATHTLTSSQGCDSIVTLDLTILNSTFGTDTQTACDSYTWIDGNTYTADNNNVTFTLVNAAGCDSIVTLDLTINNSDNVTDIQSGCNTFTWIDGNTYTSDNNTATFTLTNVAGCDSIITLDLTINGPTSGTDTQTACTSLTWIDGNTYTTNNNTATFTTSNSNGCDSTVTLDLTISSTINTTDTQTACESYTWTDGVTYTSNNNSASQTLTSYQGCDSIVTLDLTINNPSTGTDTQVACDSFTWIDGNTYTSDNNTAMFTLPNAVGCDSVVTLDLTINNSSTSIDTQEACNSFTWIDGNTYTNDNNAATFTLTNSAGCDSAVTLNLTINNPTSGTDVQTSCSDFTWIDGITYTSDNNTAMFTLTNANGCDSVVTLDLTINSAVTSSQTVSICGGNVFTVGNSNYTSSGTYTDILVSSGGCDSTVTTNLTVGVEIDTYVERLNAVFNVNTTSGATYQWLDCENNNTPIAGETNTTYTASEEGFYAVAITLGSCKDTSLCNELPYIVSIKNNDENSISVYPNPTENSVTIELNESYYNSSLTILDVTGKVVYNQLVKDQLNLNVSTKELKKGVYFIKIQAQNQAETIQLIKQ